MSKINIAIDGPAGSGKGITSKELSHKLKYSYLDTGAMYRAVALYMKQNTITKKIFNTEILNSISLSFNPENEICLNGENVENLIRTPEISELASDFSTIKEVRDFLVQQQQEIVKHKGYIAEGRDIGTRVMPNAELKIYLNASIEVRAERRYQDLKKQGLLFSFEEVEKMIEERDHQDKNREYDPLQKAEGAIEIDTSDLTIEEQIGVIEKLAKKHIHFLQ